MTTINVLRQYPAGSHNEPLRHLARHDGHVVRAYEYDLTSNITGIPRNVRFLVSSLFWSQGEQIILGAEPFDPLVPLFERLADRHNVILHTSWPRWEPDGAVPQPARFDWQHRRWKTFLQKVRAVGVTEAATVSVTEAGAADAVQIPHAVDTDTYHPDAGQIESEAPVVLFVGQLEQRKGVAELLNVITNWTGPNVRFWFVGDGPLANEVSELAANSDRVEYFGYVSDEARLAALYASADIFTLPSYHVDGWEELFGIVIIEAFASGLPVVTTNCVGPAEIVDDGETGYVVPQHDVNALTNRLIELVESSEPRESMSERARAVALDRYNSERVAEDWRRVLDL